MIVEDDSEARADLQAAVEEAPETLLVCAAQTGRDAIAQLAAHDPDVLLVDLGLPDVHGTDVIRAARRMLPACDVMVITVLGDEQSVFASIEAGATGYVLKETPNRQLVDCILELRAGGAPMSPAIARLVLDRMRSLAAAHEEGAHSAHEHTELTSREVEVLRALSWGYTYSEIGKRLRISVNTVGTHIKSSYRKLAVRTGAAAVARASELGLLGTPTSSDP
jgi:DNA-binding NarL/FixJ family response regulator